jgi:hypothetical protein
MSSATNLAGRSGSLNLKRFSLKSSIRRAWSSLEQRGASPLSLAMIALSGIGGYLGIHGPCVFMLFGCLVFEFQKRLDQGMPLMQVAALLAALQWCLGPYLVFVTGISSDRYYMYVDEETYFRLALPGTAAFAFGLLSVGSSVKQRGLLKSVRREDFVATGLILTGIAFAGRFGAPYVPGGLAFAFHLVSQLSYVGVLYFLFSRSPYRWFLISLALLPLFRQTAQSAMFHDLLLWMGMLFCFWYGMRKHHPGGKLALLGGAGLILFSIQAVKENYRAKVWKGQEASFAGEVVDFWTSAGEMKGEEVLPNVLARLNQGWIISAVMRNVPAYEPYAEGETLVSAAAGAFVPRFIWEDKAKAGGQINFRRFTGLRLADSTSMAISPLGEAYANFGVEGGIGLMLAFGLGFSSIYALCLRWSLRRPDFLFWIPLIFYQAIKAETEFVTVLNQVSKGAVIAFGGYWLVRRQVVPILFPPIVPIRRRKRRKAAYETKAEIGAETSGPSEQMPG